MNEEMFVSTPLLKTMDVLASFASGFSTSHETKRTFYSSVLAVTTVSGLVVGREV